MNLEIFRCENKKNVLSNISPASACIYVKHSPVAILFSHRRRKGCSGCNLQGKCVSAAPGHEVHPLARAKVNFRTFLLGGLDLDI